VAKVGRPTKYTPDMGQRVIELMAQGWSKEEVCYNVEDGGLGISYQSFLTYQQEHPEFLEAVKEGDRASAAWWAKTGRSAAVGGIKDFNATAWIFNMKNRFGWADKTESKTDHTSSDGSMSPTRIEIVAPDDNRTG
jgi:hypothetical protein